MFRRLSDHAPFFVKFHNKDIQISKHLHFNRHLLDTSEGRILLLDAWKNGIETAGSSTWQDRIGSALKEVKVASDQYTRNRSKKWQDTYQKEIQDILEAKEYLLSHWDDAATRDKLASAQCWVHNIQKARLDRRIHASVAK